MPRIISAPPPSVARRRRCCLLAACVTASLSVGGGLRAAPAEAAAGAPQFTVYAAPNGLHGADTSGEPSIGVDWNSGAVMYRSNSDVYRITFSGTGPRATVSWTDIPDSPSTDDLLINTDPIMATDPVTGLTLAGGNDFFCSMLAATTDDGRTWSPSEQCTGSWDHPTVGMGPFAGDVPPPGATAPHIGYYCLQEPVTGLDECTRTLDGGTTWVASTPVQDGCVSIHGHVKVSADGTAYLPDRWCFPSTSTGVRWNLASWIPFLEGDYIPPPPVEAFVGGGITRDNGLTWTTYHIPGAQAPQRGFDPSVTTTPDNTLYEAWSRASDHHPMVAWSHDHTATWSPNVDLANTIEPPIAASTFQAMVAGDNGRAAVAFLGSQVPVPTGQQPFDPGYDGVWYLFVSTTFDGGAHWTTVQATRQPVQRGYIWDLGGGDPGRNLLDFMDAAVTADGRVVVGLADGCRGCTDQQHSTHAYATIAMQSSGETLFAQPRHQTDSCCRDARGAVAPQEQGTDRRRRQGETARRHQRRSVRRRQQVRAQAE